MSKIRDNSVSFLTKFRYLSKFLKPRDKALIAIATFLLVISLAIFGFQYYQQITIPVPAQGGQYKEGIAIDSAGWPAKINPLLAIARPTDELLASLIYSSLFTYDYNGQLIGDLVEKYELEDDGRRYVLHLRPQVTWHDGQPLTAQDVVFTISLLQNQNYNPVSAKEWDQEKIKVKALDDQTVEIKLTEPYAPFLNKLTFGILPKHLWSNIPEDKFSLVELNLKPIGSGPYAFDNLKQNKQGDIISYQLVANQNYYQHKPFIEKIIFHFYPNQPAVLEAYNHQEIDGFGSTDYQKVTDFENNPESQVVSLKVPQYFSVLFNQSTSLPLADKQVRQALSLATNRDEIIAQVFKGHADKIYSPLLRPFINQDFNFDSKLTAYDLSRAAELLDKAGWKKKDGSPWRQKDNKDLKIQLTTVNTDALVQTAELLKNQWEKIGVQTEIIPVENQLELNQKYLTPRKFEALLSGIQYSGNDPNLFFFWHSSGKKSPGFNFTLYDNEEVDKLLEESKKAKSVEEKNKKYIEASEKILADAPAIFLYSPHYLYILDQKIKGVDRLKAIISPARRLQNVTEWYVKTKRVRKK